MTGANPDQHRTFLELTHTLWSPSQGDPRYSIDRDGSSSSNPSSVNIVNVPSLFAGKLQGEYTWPFSIDLPKEVFITSGRDKKLQSFPLPQTFNERYARGSIDYELVLRISRSRLRPDYRYAFNICLSKILNATKDTRTFWIYTFIPPTPIFSSQTSFLPRRGATLRTFH